MLCDGRIFGLVFGKWFFLVFFFFYSCLLGYTRRLCKRRAAATSGHLTLLFFSYERAMKKLAARAKNKR